MPTGEKLPKITANEKGVTVSGHKEGVTVNNNYKTEIHIHGSAPESHPTTTVTEPQRIVFFSTQRKRLEKIEKHRARMQEAVKALREKEGKQDNKESPNVESPKAETAGAAATQTPNAAPKTESAPEKTTEKLKPLRDKGIEEVMEKMKARNVAEASASTPKPAAEKKPDAFTPDENRLLRLALASRGPEAMRELQKQLQLDKGEKIDGKLGKRTNQERRAKAMEQAEKMLTAEGAYFVALKEFHRTKGFHSVIGDKFNPDGRMLPPNVQALKDAWIASRSSYAEFMRNSAEDSHRKRHERYTGKTAELLTDRVMERYQRRFMVKEVVLGAEKAEQRARLEGLSTRDKKGIEKFFDKYQKGISKGLRIFGTGAMITMGMAAGISGSPIVGIGALLFGGASAFSLYKAAKAKDGSEEKKKWERRAQLTSFAGIFGWVGDKLIRGGHSLNKTVDKAHQTLEKREGLGDLTSVQNMKNIAHERKRATQAEEVVEADARMGRLAGSLIGGAAVGGALHGHLGLGGGFEHHKTVSELSIGEHAGGHTIYDGERLLGHFANKLHNHHFPGGHVPKSVQAFEKLLHVKGHKGFAWSAGENRASKLLGFEGPNGSVVMQPHDSLKLLDNGDIILHRPGHPEMDTLIMDSQGNPHQIDTFVWHQAPVGHHAPGSPTHEMHEGHDMSAAASNDTSHDHDDVALNNEQHQKDLAEDAARHYTQPPTSTHIPVQSTVSQPENAASTQQAYENFKHNFAELKAEHQAERAAEHTAPPHSEVMSAVAAHQPPHAPDLGPIVQPPPHIIQGSEHAVATDNGHIEAESAATFHAEPGSVAAWNQARVAPAGTEVPYISHVDPSGPHWNSWVSDGKGQVHEILGVDSANGKHLPPAA